MCFSLEPNSHFINHFIPFKSGLSWLLSRYLTHNKLLSIRKSDLLCMDNDYLAVMINQIFAFNIRTRIPLFFKQPSKQWRDPIRPVLLTLRQLSKQLYTHPCLWFFLLFPTTKFSYWTPYPYILSDFNNKYEFNILLYISFL